MVDILIDDGRVLNVFSPYIDIFKVAERNTDMCEHTRWGIHYALFELSDTDDDGGEELFDLSKCGLTNYPSERCAEYNEDFPNFDSTHEILPVSYFDRIPKVLDLKLSKCYKELVLSIAYNDATPEGMRRWFTNKLSPAEDVDGRDWHTGGVKRIDMQQLIEVGIQRRFNVGSPGEAFMWDDAKHNHLVNNVAIPTVE